MSFIVCGSCSELIMSNIHVCKQTSRNMQICKNCEYLEKENQHLKSQLALCVEALEFLSKIDTAEKAPDFMWLNDWRNNAKILTKECLDKLTAMQSEGEK